MSDCEVKVKTVCSHCGKVRSEHCKPWTSCPKCGKTLCLSYNCSLAGMCHSCWDKEYAEKKKMRLVTPVECRDCHEKKLPAQFEIPDYPSTCKACVGTKEQRRKLNAKPGLVEVTYGKHPVPDEDGGRGYAYYFNQPLRLGDVVQVPQTWLGRLREESNGPKLATVVSTYSAYDGDVSGIICIVRRARKKATK